MIAPDFDKTLKSADDLTSFFVAIHQQDVQHILEAMLAAHLDNEQQQKTTSGNYDNDHGTKK